MSTVLLLDDERSFKDNRDAMVARSTYEAINLTDKLSELDELWLDFVLCGTDSTDEFLRHLRGRKYEGNPLRLKTVYIHTSAWGAVDLLKQLLNMLDVPAENIHRVEHTDFFITPGR